MQNRFFYILLILNSALQAQHINTQIFFDEDYAPITKLDFQSKIKSPIYGSQIIMMDSIQSEKLRPNYQFGQLNEKALESFKKFVKDAGYYLDNKNVILSYGKKIIGYKDLIKLAENGEGEMPKISERGFNRNKKENDKLKKKCAKEAEKNNSIAIYSFGEMTENAYKPKNYELKKLPLSLRKELFPENCCKMTIVKPTGEFFTYSYLTDSQIKKFLNEDWSIYKKELVIAKVDYFNSNNFIKNMRANFETTAIEIAKKQVSNRNSTKLPQKIIGANSKRTYSTRIRIKSCFGYANF